MFLGREGMKRPRARYVATRFELKRDCVWSDVVSRGDDEDEDLDDGEEETKANARRRPDRRQPQTS